jgi:hypothetical protein
MSLDLNRSPPVTTTKLAQLPTLGTPPALIVRAERAVSPSKPGPSARVPPPPVHLGGHQKETEPRN